MTDKQFLNGLSVKPPREGAPDFVKCAISIKRAELINTLQTMSGDWVNVDIKESKGGKWYAEVNTWKPDTNKLKQDMQKPRASADPAFFPDDDVDF